jgi:hypothetical protein
MTFYSEDKYLRSAVRAALDEVMKLNVAKLADDQDFPDRELFEMGDQDKDGWELTLHIEVGTEWASIWTHPDNADLVVVRSDGGNEHETEVWEVA